MGKLKVLILTVKEYPERMPNVMSLIDLHAQIGLSSEILYGVNGRHIEVTDTEDSSIKTLTHEGQTLKYDRRIRTNGCVMTPGELGCAWSHIRALESLLADPDYDMYLILEDDAAPVCDISNIADHIQHLPESFDLCRLAKSVWYPFIKEAQINSHYYSYVRRYTSCAAAYIVTKSGAEKLLSAVNGTIGIPADDLLSNTYIRNSAFVSCIPADFMYHDPRILTSVIDQLSAP
jgi:GR25 family glycosyltransferase involved in LPS biosynthesis